MLHYFLLLIFNIEKSLRLLFPYQYLCMQPWVNHFIFLDLHFFIYRIKYQDLNVWIPNAFTKLMCIL